MSTDNGIRIAVGERGGRRSSTWRIWFGPKDIYAGFHTLGGIRKASIHYPRPNLPTTARYIGYTREHAKSVMSAREITREMRTHAKWPGAEIAPGMYVEFRFRIPESELRPLTETEDRSVIWLKPAPRGMGTEVTILSGPPGYAGSVPTRSDGEAAECLFEDRLQNGRKVWVLHHDIPAVDDLDEQRRLVRRSFMAGGLWRPGELVDPETRVNLTATCPDGSAAEIELAGDFLNK